MTLLRFVERTKDLHLPDGRVVKVTVNDANTTQHVEDPEGRVHGTTKPPPIAITVRQYRSPRVRQAFHYDEDIHLWAPLPGDAVATPEPVALRHGAT